MKALIVAIGLVMPVASASKIEHNVISCSIFNMEKKLIRRYPGLMCRFFPNGNLVARTGRELILYDSQMNKLWSKTMHNHHLLNVTEDSRLLVMGSTVHRWKGKSVRFDLLQIVNLSGKVEHEFDFFANLNQFRKLPHAHGGGKTELCDFTWDTQNMTDATMEYSHANSFYEIPENPSANKVAAFKKGNFIINANCLGYSFILDRELKKVLWSYRFEPAKPGYYLHDVQVLGNGNLLIYVNIQERQQKMFSSLEEIDPVTKNTVWHYEASPPEAFDSRYSGGVQILENNNVLFSDITRGGMALEVDRSGHEKWRLVPPNKDPKTNLPYVIQDVKRYDLSEFLSKNKGL